MHQRPGAVRLAQAKGYRTKKITAPGRQTSSGRRLDLGVGGNVDECAVRVSDRGDALLESRLCALLAAAQEEPGTGHSGRLKAAQGGSAAGLQDRCVEVSPAVLTTMTSWVCFQSGP
jgi:hypothetical protein